MNIAPWTLSLALAAALLAGPAPAGPYTDPVYGFSIEALKAAPTAAGTSVTPVMFFAPAENGFAPNLGVMVQASPMGLEAYAELSRGQFKELKVTVNAETRLKVAGRDALLWDYQGKMQGRELRFLALAVPDKGRVFLATFTSTAEAFAKHEKAARASLDSFTLPE